LFAGISHGGALAQAAALRYGLQQPGYAARIFVVSWNAYKWTEKKGALLAHEVLGSRLLPVVLSTESGQNRRWDSVPEFPPGFAQMPDPLLLDVDSGAFFGNLRLGEASLSLNFATRFLELHFAKAAIEGMKKATENEANKRLRSMSRISWREAKQRITSSFRRSSTSFMSGQSFRPGTNDQEFFETETRDDAHDGDSDDESAVTQSRSSFGQAHGHSAVPTSSCTLSSHPARPQAAFGISDSLLHNG
jgi:hypothetical protein